LQENTNDTATPPTLPPDLTIGKIIRSIPADCLRPSLGRSISYLLRDFATAIIAIVAIVMVSRADLSTTATWALGLPLAILLGLALGGLFVLAHDCGHRSFARSVRMNNIFGHICSSVTLWPFHVWRADHDLHHRHTDHIDLDPAWRPVTWRMWRKMPRLSRWIYLQTRSRFFFLGSIYTTWLAIKMGVKDWNNQKLSPEARSELRWSLVFVFICASIEIVGSVVLAGWFGFICLFVIPQLVFHAQLSTATLFHHTSPDSRFLDRKEWTIERAQLAGSIHVSYPRWVEFFWHDINWHVPHHVCVGIPHYRLREAHAALKSTWPELVREKVFTAQLVRETLGTCHFIKSKAPSDLSWTTKVAAEHAAAEVAAARQCASKVPSPS